MQETTNRYREITPLSENDFFRIYSRHKSCFDFPLHYHQEYEINLILGAAGAQRVIGSHIGEIGDTELIMVGPNLIHCWNDGDHTTGNIKEVTIQFNDNIFGGQFLHKNQMYGIKKMFDDSSQGILFSGQKTDEVKQSILTLCQSKDFGSLLGFLQLLHQLSQDDHMTLLSDVSFSAKEVKFDSRRIEKVFDFMYKNYHKQIKLSEVAAIANMSAVSFCRFVKQRTGRSFIECLNEIRLGQVTRLLIDTDMTVAEIAYECGFNNIAYFNRIFKEKKGLTPKEYRQTYIQNSFYI